MEMRTRLFLRTSEFLWQEGHLPTQHGRRLLKRLKGCKCLFWLCWELYGSSVVKGYKSESERLPVLLTHMPLKLWCRTERSAGRDNHFLGQNFAKAFDVQFTDRQEAGLRMALHGACHKDNRSLIMATQTIMDWYCLRVCPIQVGDKLFTKQFTTESISAVAKKLNWPWGKRISVKYDDRDTINGVEICRLRAEGRSCPYSNRSAWYRKQHGWNCTQGYSWKRNIPLITIIDYVSKLLVDIQKNIYTKPLNSKRKTPSMWINGKSLSISSTTREDSSWLTGRNSRNRGKDQGRDKSNHQVHSVWLPGVPANASIQGNLQKEGSFADPINKGLTV